jgi:hypothetical protein
MGSNHIAGRPDRKMIPRAITTTFGLVYLAAMHTRVG